MGILDQIVDVLKDVWNTCVDAIGNVVFTALSNFFGKLCYYFTSVLMWAVDILQQLFNVFSGTSKVQYGDQWTYLTDVFFKTQSVVNVYWAMALVAIVLVILFTGVAVVRKMFDIGDKQQKSMGSILGNMLKSIFIMLVLSLLLSASINLSNILLNRISYIFDNADSFHEEASVHFTEDQYAAMGRIYATIGNYSLNQSYNNRYNLNKCFNEIRGDLYQLEQQGVFDYVYYTADEKGNEIPTWQSELQRLSYAANTSRDLKLDVYYEEVSTTLLEIMKTLKTNKNFYALGDYQTGYSVTNGVGLDKILFLSGTTWAARNEKYNENPYLTDGLRGAFYTGIKSIYSFEDVSEAFDVSMSGIMYIFIWVLTYFTMRNLFRCIFTCISRIFNMVSLYMIAPLAVSSMPLDDGAKIRSWTTAMVIQELGVLGSIIPMRLIILFAPIVMNPKLVLFESTLLNFIAKVLLIVGGMQAVEGFSGMVSGLLTNNAAAASAQANQSAASMGGKAFSATTGAAGAVVGGAAKVGLGAAKVAGKLGLGAAKFGADMTGLTYVGNKIGGGLSSAFGKAGDALTSGMDHVRKNGGLIGTAVNAMRGTARTDAAGSKGGGDDKTSGGDGAGGAPQNLSQLGQGGAGGDGPKPGASGGVGGGNSKPLDPVAQNLFGVDAGGKPKQNSGGQKPGGGSNPKPPQAQNNGANKQQQPQNMGGVMQPPKPQPQQENGGGGNPKPPQQQPQNKGGLAQMMKNLDNAIENKPPEMAEQPPQNNNNQINRNAVGKGQNAGGAADKGPQPQQAQKKSNFENVFGKPPANKPAGNNAAGNNNPVNNNNVPQQPPKPNVNPPPKREQAQKPNFAAQNYMDIFGAPGGDKEKK